MKKARKKVPPGQEGETPPPGPVTETPPETEEENPETIDPAVLDTGNPPPTKPSPIKK